MAGRRCDKNYDVVANIRSVKTNGLAVLRLLDENNTEAKKTVAAATIENIYPKTANVKAVLQNTPSQNGREAETDQHYFWRSSQRLRHKHRAISQWDFEQLVLENFENIFKVKCLNHAYFDEGRVIAKATKAIISLIPHYLINAVSLNFQPALPVSKLTEIKQFLLSKTSSFVQLQVLNAQWDEIQVTLDVVLNPDILDRPFYQTQLDEDIKRFFSPWAFQSSVNPLLAQKIFVSTLVDLLTSCLMCTTSGTCR